MITNVIIVTIAPVANELELDPQHREELKNYEFIKGGGIDYCNSKETRWKSLTRIGRYI